MCMFALHLDGLDSMAKALSQVDEYGITFATMHAIRQPMHAHRCC